MAGQISDYIGARALLSGLPDFDWLLRDCGYDADWFREVLKDKEIGSCIPGRKLRKTTVKYDIRRYKRRNRIEIMFGRLKDWRRAATRYDRSPKVFLSAIALAALVIYWLGVLSHPLSVRAKIRCCSAFRIAIQQSFALILAGTGSTFQKGCSGLVFLVKKALLLRAASSGDHARE